MRRALQIGAVLALLANAPDVRAQDDDALVETVQELQKQVRRLQAANEEALERLRRLESRATSAQASTSVVGAAGDAGNALNPRVTAFVDAGGSLSTDGDNGARNRFNLREAEIDFRAAITPSADGVVILALGEEIEVEDGDTEIDTKVELEEAYIEFHSLIDDVSFKFGKFRSSFGANNRLHTHDLPQVSRPLAVSAFLGPEGLKTIGASGSWLVPNPWERWIELTAELTNTDGGDESPILGGPDADNPTLLARLSLFEDVSADASLELGASFLHGRNETPYVVGADATWTWRDPDKPDFTSFLLQAEAFWSNSEFGDDLERDAQFGAYAFAQYQFSDRWYAGARYDYTQTPGTEASLRGSTWGLSPYVTWYPAESLRLRLEYQHLQRDLLGSGNSEEAVLFGITWFIGAHPAHPYWVNK